MNLEIKYEYDDKRWCTIMIINHHGKEIARFHDDMEPEDAAFNRDLSWIADMLDLVYCLGMEDGKKRG